MAISDGEWESIRQLINDASRKHTWPFSVGRVSRVNDTSKLIWVGNDPDPIPVFAFDVEVIYYDETPHGTSGYSLTNPPGNPYRTKKVKTVAEVKMPEPGDYALLARLSSDPSNVRCIGILKSKNMSDPSFEE